MTRLFTTLLLIVALAYGVATRAYAIAQRELWYDEAFSWHLTRYSLREMMHRVVEDVHPPLYYLALKLWTSLWGSGACAMRSLSVIWGGVSIIGTYLFVAEAFRERREGQSANERRQTNDSASCPHDHPPLTTRSSSGHDLLLITHSQSGHDSIKNQKSKIKNDISGLALLAAVLVATSIFQIRYAWEVRMYSQGVALAALSHWALFRALRPDSSAGWWVGWSVISAAFAYTHYFAFFTLAAQGLFVAGYGLSRRARVTGEEFSVHRTHSTHPSPLPLSPRLEGRGAGGEGLPTLTRAALAATVLALLYSPWVKPFLHQQAQVQESFWPWPVDRWTVPATIFQMLGGGPATDTFHRGIEHASMAACTAAVVLALLLLFCTGSAAERFLVLSAVLPFALTVGLSALTDRSIYSSRYFSFAHLSLVIVAAALVWRIPAGPIRTSAALVAVALNVALGTLFIVRLDAPHRTGIRGAAELLGDRAATGEPVAMANSRVFFPMLFYTAGRTPLRLISAPENVEHFAGRQILDPGNLITGDELWCSQSRSVWVVDTSGFGGFSVVVPSTWVPAEVWTFPELFWWQGDIAVTRYVRRGD